MKILCVIDSLGSGGAQRQMVELAKGFKEKGHEVSFLTYHEINFFKPELDSTGIPVTTLIETNYFKRILKIRKFIRREKPDSIIAFLQGASFMATIAGFPYRKWKLIVGERSANPNILTSFKMKFYRFFHFFTDYVIANSKANLDLVKKVNPYLNENKLKVIYNMVNTPNVQFKSRFENSVLKIVVAASVRPVKNIDGLILAISQLPQEYKEKIQVDWYGSIEDVKYANSIRELIKKCDVSKEFNLLPPTDQIFKKYLEADFVGLFSHYEGFPNAICEAMSLGAPVIVTNISDIPYFIKNDVNGFVCQSNDIESIKFALMKAVDSNIENRKIMGTKNIEVTVRNFSKEMILKQYIEFLKK